MDKGKGLEQLNQATETGDDHGDPPKSGARIGRRAEHREDIEGAGVNHLVPLAHGLGPRVGQQGAHQGQGAGRIEDPSHEDPGQRQVAFGNDQTQSSAPRPLVTSL